MPKGSKKRPKSYPPAQVSGPTGPQRYMRTLEETEPLGQTTEHAPVASTDSTRTDESTTTTQLPTSDRRHRIQPTPPSGQPGTRTGQWVGLILGSLSILVTIAAGIYYLGGRIEGNATSINFARSTMDKLSTSVDKTSEAIARLETQVERMTSDLVRLDSLPTNISSMQTSTQYTRDALRQHEHKIDALSEKLATIRAELQKLLAMVPNSTPPGNNDPD